MKKALVLVIVAAMICAFTGCSNSKQVISTKDAPAAIGPYNQAIVQGGTVYCSGQIAINPKTNEFVGGGIVKQTNQVFENIDGLLAACGSSKEKIVKCNVFLKDIGDFDKMNEIYASYFEGCDYPARSAVEVANLPKGALIEIEVVAEK